MSSNWAKSTRHSPIGNRASILAGVVDSAKHICGKVDHHEDEPCMTCINNMAMLHARFLAGLPPAVLRMAPGALCEAIRSSALQS